jgi:hypothetical protein
MFFTPTGAWFFFGGCMSFILSRNRTLRVHIMHVAHNDASPAVYGSLLGIKATTMHAFAHSHSYE